MSKPLPSQKSDPKADLIAATEQILSSSGIHAATVRSITALAGTNGAAINYHFGSQEELFGVVCNIRMQPANRAIIKNLQALEDEDTGPSIEKIFTPLVRTALDVWVNDDVLRALRSALFFNPQTADAMNEASMADVYVHMRGALMRACPHLPTRQIRKRFRMAMSTIMHVVAAEDAHLTWAREEVEVEDLVNYVSAGFRE